MTNQKPEQKKPTQPITKEIPFTELRPELALQLCVKYLVLTYNRLGYMISLMEKKQGKK